MEDFRELVRHVRLLISRAAERLVIFSAETSIYGLAVKVGNFSRESFLFGEPRLAQNHSFGEILRSWNHTNHAGHTACVSPLMDGATLLHCLTSSVCKT